ncbi:MAG TPA: hypothetical protein VFS43_03440 [Polyangiaceae bacterium]|nr:hypothetical protein [Polyangiaceae bacterium]
MLEAALARARAAGDVERKARALQQKDELTQLEAEPDRAKVEGARRMAKLQRLRRRLGKDLQNAPN